jgi:hypothetical protein
LAHRRLFDGHRLCVGAFRFSDAAATGHRATVARMGGFPGQVVEKFWLQRIATQRRTQVALTIDFVDVFVPYHSPRDGFTTYSALSPAIGRSCHRRLRGMKGPLGHFIALRKLHASVEALRPRGFVVRSGRIRLVHHLRPSHPAPTFVTIAKRPSWRARDDRALLLFLPNQKTKFFSQQGWTRRANQCLSA